MANKSLRQKLEEALSEIAQYRREIAAFYACEIAINHDHRGLPEPGPKIVKDYINESTWFCDNLPPFTMKEAKQAIMDWDEPERI